MHAFRKDGLYTREGANARGSSSSSTVRRREIPKPRRPPPPSFHAPMVEKESLTIEALM